MRITTQERVRSQDAYNAATAQAIERNLRNAQQVTEPYAITRDYTFKDDDNIDSLQVDATAGNIVITLPQPNGNRRRRIIKTDTSANTVTISGNGYLISSEASVVLPRAFLFIEVEATGTAWVITTYGQTRVLSDGSTFVGPGVVATTATGGFIYITTCAGTPTGVPSFTGTWKPLVYDTTNHILYIYDGAWLQVDSVSTSALTSGTTSAATSLSTNISGAGSSGVSAGTRASTADSKAVSLTTLESNDVSSATSKDTSQSTLISSLTSRVSSKGG